MSKQALKAAKACIDSKNWAGADTQCRKALSFEPQSYLAHLFLGLTLFNLEDYDESENAYRQAIQIEAEERQRKDRKENPASWQGLLKLFETQKRIDKYMDVAVRLAGIYRDQDERTKCDILIEKTIAFVEEHGSKDQYKRALHILLPGSPVFDYLDGLIPRPERTYLKLAEIIEAEEKERINKEIANRRSRLGSVLGQITTDVRREVWSVSPLEELYQNILNWSDDEELRRQIECKLLQHGYNKLLVFPKETKLQQRVKVESWARGLVILKYPFELAWRIVIEWKDCESIGDHDINILREYIKFFPESGLAISLKAFLDSGISPFPVIPDEEKETTEPTSEEEKGGKDAEEGNASDQRLDAMIDGVEKSPTSVLCHRILGEYYLLLEEYENAVDVSRGGIKFIGGESQRTGLACQKNQDALTVTLATALIHYQVPKHHNEAKSLFETVLKHNPSHGSALVGLGLILEEQQDYSGAVDLLNRALSKDPENARIMSEAAWCNVLQGHYSIGQQGLENCLGKITGNDPRSRELKAQILWRIGTCLWNSDGESRGDRKGGPYHYFIAALQNSQNFAPAYTSLGCFYADIMSDTVRANKCFQRAFEISAGEVEAAERLARSFAETKEWELVEIVARRVAEADKKRCIPGKGISWPQSAIGVVELNNQNYALAIQSFQSALRGSPKDFHSWIGLGEAYASSGRYTAALKVFSRAEALNENNWFAKYMLANVRRELGEFEIACEGYRAVLALKEREFGVLVALSETLLAMAWKYVETGYYGRAADGVVECLSVAGKVVEERSDTFNLWKTIGDACVLFTWVQNLAHKFPRTQVLSLLEYEIEPSEFDIMAEVDGVGRSAIETIRGGELDDVTAAVYAGLLAYKRAIFATAEDRHAHAVAWYNLGTAEYRAYEALPKRETKHRLASIRCFKRTIKLEPGNHEFWNALGLATAELNPKVAQHSLVRALYINEKSARVWTNLGTLYAIQEDYILANEAFSRAQSTDPEYALAWVGQGLIAMILGEKREAQELFQHAFEIADQSLTPAKKHFITSTFDTLVKTKSEPALASILTPIFALEKLEAQLSKIPTVLQLSALFDERVGGFAAAVEKLERVCSIYEERYEETEADDDLAKFARSKADVARMHLGLHQYAEAIEAASMALDLSGDIDHLQSCRLSAHLTAGLAHYYSQEMDESLEMFKEALTESEENPDVVCLLSQVLWAKGGEEERDVARDQLFACIEANPEHLGSILLLGTIGVLDRSEDVTEAVLDDLRGFRAKDRLSREVREQIDNLLIAIAQGQQEEVASAASAVFMGPAVAENWGRLAKVAEDAFVAETTLRVARRGAVGGEGCERLAAAYAGMATVGAGLRAVFLAPWKREGWETVAACVKPA